MCTTKSTRPWPKALGPRPWTNGLGPRAFGPRPLAKGLVPTVLGRGHSAQGLWPKALAQGLGPKALGPRPYSPLDQGSTIVRRSVSYRKWPQPRLHVFTREAVPHLIAGKPSGLHVQVQAPDEVDNRLAPPMRNKPFWYLLKWVLWPSLVWLLNV